MIRILVSPHLPIISCKLNIWWVRLFFLVVTVMICTSLTFAWGKNYIIYINYKSVVFSSLVFAVAYTLLSFLFTPILGFLIITSSTTLIRLASNRKEEHTLEPIIWGDLSHLNHLNLALKFIPYSQLIIIGAILFILSILLIRSLYIKYSNNKSLLLLIIPIVLIGTIFIKNHRSDAIKELNKWGITYNDWDWHHNSVENGLLVHLLQTSNRPSPEKLTEEQKLEFNELINEAKVTRSSPSLFINILCESCWYDDSTFSDAFYPIVEIGGLEMRGISPIFGGGTPNASIEILTGLPIVNSALSGVVYQEYRDFIRNNTSTLPSHLQSNGVNTLSAHNFAKRFWFRNTVKPRLGFNNFYGIEDMHLFEKSDDYFPRDTILFDFTLEKIKNIKTNQQYFINLATVHTHSPYLENDGDGGVAHYYNKISVSISDMKTFINKVIKVNPDVVFLIYGDHKPRLPVLDNYKYAGYHDRGDMPVILIDLNLERAQHFKENVNGKPFYCYPPVIANIYYGFELPISNYTNSICKHYTRDKYEVYSNSLPSWIYTAALFK